MRHTTITQISHAVRTVMASTPEILSVRLQPRDGVIMLARGGVEPGTVTEHNLARVALAFTLRKPALEIVGSDDQRQLHMTVNNAMRQITGILSPDGAPLALECGVTVDVRGE